MIILLNSEFNAFQNVTRQQQYLISVPNILQNKIKLDESTVSICEMKSNFC